MHNAGIVAEYNPFHSGHAQMIRRVRERLGAGCGIVCAMSGKFVQRGDFALLGKYARAEAAVRCGADLVLELPLPWAVSSAEGFARGGVGVLAASGVVDTLAFGSECADAALLHQAARGLEAPAFPGLLRRELEKGDSFAVARQRALEQLVPPEAAAGLASPNDLLAVEYCRCLDRMGTGMVPLAIRREGAGHDAPLTEGPFSSASALRALIADGRTEAALERLPEPVRLIYRREAADGRAPVWGATCQRAILARLRTMERDDYAAIDEGGEGLGNRMYAASRTAATLDELLTQTKTKRYALARIRRMVLWAYLGLKPAERPAAIPYLRPLAANERGRKLLRRMQECAAAPVLTKPADVRHLGEAAQALFAQEVRAADLYALAYPQLSAAGSEWRRSPVML